MSADLLPVRSEAARGALIQEMLARIEHGDLDPLLACGLDGHLIDRLRALRGGALHQVIGASRDVFAVALDPRHLRLILDALDGLQRADALLEYYVSHGASLAMIRALLRPGKGQLEAFLERLAGTRLRGRPALPATAVRDRIHAAWTALRAAHPKQAERETYVELHRAFPDQTLATLYAVLQEFRR